MPSKKNDKSIPTAAVIGSGYWGRHLIRNMHRLGALRLICDISDALLSQFRAAYPGVETCVALSEILTRSDIDALVVATPAETHFRIAREALIAGKHVFIEKPMAMVESEGRALVDMAEAKGRVLMVGHLLQFHPAFKRLKEMASDGALGRINYIYSNRLNLGKIRREENILWSFAPHDISMILALARETPTTIQATGGNYLHSRIADVTTTHLSFPSGLKAHIFVSWLHPFKEQKLVVVGDRKMAVFDDTLPWSEKLSLYPHIINWEENIPVPTRGERERVAIGEQEPLAIECGHFLDCIVHGRRPLTDGEEGLKVLRVLNASQSSLDHDGQPVHLQSAADGLRHADPGKIHPTAVIDDGATVGPDTRIWHFSHILPGSRIGEGCTIGQNVVVGPDVTIGNRCKIQNNVSIYKGVTLEDGVFCGPSMVFTNVYNPRAEIRKMDQLRPTMVRRGATIGANATIVCGVTIGRYAFVGAGAVVTRDVADHALVFGNPARTIGWMCRCGERLDENLKCSACATVYTAAPDRPGLKQVRP